jgi:hypothetical protein
LSKLNNASLEPSINGADSVGRIGEDMDGVVVVALEFDS